MQYRFRDVGPSSPTHDPQICNEETERRKRKKMKVLHFLAYFAIALVVLGSNTAFGIERASRRVRNRFKRVYKRMGFKKWRDCNGFKVRRNPCACGRIECNRRKTKIKRIDLSNNNLKPFKPHSRPLPNWDINRLLQVLPDLEYLDMRNNPAIPDVDSGCILIPMCDKPGSSLECHFDQTICGLGTDVPTLSPTPKPTKSPTLSPTDAPVLAPTQSPTFDTAAAWTTFYTDTDGPNWRQRSRGFEDWPCDDSPNGGSTYNPQKRITCVNGEVERFNQKNQRLASTGSLDPNTYLSPFLASSQLVEMDLTDNPDVTWSTCLDPDHIYFEPYGHLPRSVINSGSDTVTLCTEPEGIASTPEEAFQSLYDNTGGNSWNRCAARRDEWLNCGRLSFDGSNIVEEVNFSNDMGFSGGDASFQVYRFMRGILTSGLTKMDLSGNLICWPHEYLQQIGCGETVTCTFHPNC